MVESTKSKKVALGIENINKDTRINYTGDYYECAICLEIPYNDPILECPKCHYKAC